MDIKETLAKLKALTASPNKHEADTAQRLYDKIKGKYNLTEEDLDPTDVRELREFGISFTQADGWTTYQLDTSTANDAQIEKTLYHILMRNARRKKEETKGKLLLPNEQVKISQDSIDKCIKAEKEGK
jgi:hypothetical protein